MSDVEVAGSLGREPLPCDLVLEDEISKLGHRPDPGSLSAFSVSRFGAIGDGVAKDTAAVQAAIEAANAAGGGRVDVEAGIYMCGTIHLRSNVELHLQPGAIIWGSPDREDYCEERPNLVKAVDAENVSITGTGVLYGNANAYNSFFKPDGKNVHTRKPYPTGWRPAEVVFFDRCKRVRIYDVTMQAPPSWTLHPRCCDQVWIRGINVVSGTRRFIDKNENGDGINPDHCSRVFISDCFIQSSDDGLVIKNTKIDDPEQQAMPCQDIVVTNCIIRTPLSAIKFGTETNADFRRIRISNIVIQEAGRGINFVMRDGGLIEDVQIDNVSISQLGEDEHGCALGFSGERRDADVPAGRVRNVLLSNIRATSYSAIEVSAESREVFDDITLRDVRLRVHSGQEVASDEPYGIDGKLAEGFSCENVTVELD